MAESDLKIVLLGSKNVGKTCLFNRLIYNKFGSTAMTIGAYFANKQMNVQDRCLNLAVWDTAGEEKFHSLTSFYFRNAQAALVIFDITSYSSFTSLSKWLERLFNVSQSDCVVLIVGNKVDLIENNTRMVHESDVQKLIDSLQIPAQYLECSAKSGENINDLLSNVVNRYLSLHPFSTHTLPALHTRETLELALPESESDKGWCCL